MKSFKEFIREENDYKTLSDGSALHFYDYGKGVIHVSHISDGKMNNRIPDNKEISKHLFDAISDPSIKELHVNGKNIKPSMNKSNTYVNPPGNDEERLHKSARFPIGKLILPTKSMLYPGNDG